MFGSTPGRTASLTLTIAAATALDTTPAAIQEDPPDLGTNTAVVQEWTAHPAIMSFATKPDERGTARNVLALEADGDELRFFVNEELVWSGQHGALAVDGVFGPAGQSRTRPARDDHHIRVAGQLTACGQDVREADDPIPLGDARSRVSSVLLCHRSAAERTQPTDTATTTQAGFAEVGDSLEGAHDIDSLIAPYRMQPEEELAVVLGHAWGTSSRTTPKAQSTTS